MQRRMLAMLGVLAGLAALLLTDTPADNAGVVVAAAAPRRAPRLLDPAPTAPAAPAMPALAPVDADAPVVDLFAAHDAAPVKPAASAAPPDAGADEPAAPLFTLLGFKYADGVREAYLTHNNDMLVARSGVTLLRRYRVLALRSESVRLLDQHTGAAFDARYQANDKVKQ